MSADNLGKVISLVAEELGLPPSGVNADSSSDTLPEWDSEAHLNICLAFEDRFGIKLDMAAIGEVTSVAGLVKALA